MSEHQVSIANGRLVALMPHLIGAPPENSLVVLPLDASGKRCPVMVFQVPDEANDWKAEARRFESYAGVSVALVAYADHARADATVTTVQNMLRGVDVDVQTAVATDGTNWVELNTGDIGVVTEADRDRVAVEFIQSGRRNPYDSMEQMRASFRPSAGEDLAGAMNESVLHTVEAAKSKRSLLDEERWMSHTLVDFVSSGNLPGDVDLGRLLCDVQLVPLRDHAFTEITHENAAAHAALWKHITTRSPEEARAPAATLTAFGMWLAGDGMQARLALEQVPGRYELANLVGTAVAAGLDPATWTTPDPESKVYTDTTPEHDSPRPTTRRDVPPAAPDAGDTSPRR